MACAAPWNDRAAYQWTVEATVYVDASKHGHGVGDAPYTELLGRLRRQGFRSVVSVIPLPNDPLVYQTAGGLASVAFATTQLPMRVALPPEW